MKTTDKTLIEYAIKCVNETRDLQQDILGWSRERDKEVIKKEIVLCDETITYLQSLLASI